MEDPFNEFIVKENKNYSKENIEKDFNDQYWQERFTYKDEMIPIFLAKHKEKILHSGKYLHVIRECGKDIKYPYPEHENMLISGSRVASDQPERRNAAGEDEEMKDPNQSEMNSAAGSQFDFFLPIEKAYEWSSAELLNLVFGECQLIKRLESIKHFFFLDRGDFFLHFVEGSEDILEQTTSTITIEKLESYLEMAIRTSTANTDPFKEDVSCFLNTYGLIEQIFAVKTIKGALG